MALTDIDIANAVFIKLGLMPAVSLSEPTDQVTAFNNIFPILRRRALMAGKWRFARIRASLTKNATDPVFDWDAAYDIPAASLLVLSTDDDGLPWLVEGTTILTNRDSMTIIYIRDEKDPNKFIHLFVEALTELVASELAVALTGRADLKEEHFKIYLHKMQEARTLESQQGTPPTLTMDELESARFGSAYG